MWWVWALTFLILIFGFVVFRGAPYVPSRKRHLTRAFKELYPLGSNDVLVDIGSGDGIVLREAAKRGATAIGYELNPILVIISRLLSRKQSLVRVHLADFWSVSLPAETTVVYVFGESRDIVKMARKVADEAARLQKPLAFISYGFAVPGLTPVKTDGAYYLYQITSLQSGDASV
ncbi:MAG TPA: methyltransferase domain-containing protein [Candidatus Saccharimonadales bacterium]|nr:methyltransferase domain-containing protein [Candidatus Saccharimonadales bacterium]